MKKKYLPNPYSFQSAETGKRRFAEFLTTILKKGLSFLAVTLFPTFILFLTATGTISAQTVTVSNAGSIVSGDYTYYGIVNGKNAYLRNYRDYSSNTYCSGSSCLEELRIYWDNEKWVLTSKAEGGDCWVCPTGAETLIASNTESGSPAAPCSAWTSSFYENLTLTGSCQGGALSDLVLSATSLCQTGVLTLNWVNNATLGVGNVFTVTLSDESGNYNSGTTELGTLASTTAISMMVTLPAYMASSAGYTLRLTASQAPESAYTFTSPTFTIGLPNERPSSLPSGISVCEGQPATLETLSTYASYQWYKGETTQISGADGQQYIIASVTESDEGFYSVLGVTGDGCRTDISSGIQLNVNNAPSIDYSYYPAPVCEGALENGLSVTSYGAGTYTYTWKKGGEIVKTETTTSNTSTYVPVGGWLTSHAGSYTATVSQVGCPNPAVSSEALLEVDQELETPTLTPSGSAVAPVTFTATAGFRRYNLYKWDGTAYSFYTDYHTNTFTISIGGKYLVRGQNACGETANSNEVSVTTLCDIPPVLATSSENSIPATLTTTSGFHYYLWYKWNGSEYVYVTTTSANSYSATAYGQYSVRATSGCGTTVFSNAATIVDQCKGETVAPQILSLPSTLNAPCGSPATWTVSASDNCTVPERITFRYYITGGSAIGAVDNLQNGTGSGTVFTADAVVHIIAIDAAGNVSAERTISITAGGDCTPPTGIPLDGLIAWYPFNGNANDESGHNLHGTGTDVALTTDRFGNEGKAYDFNGSSSFIEVADNEAWFRPDQISVSLWVNSRSNSDLQNFFGKAHFGYWSNSWGLASDFGGGNGAFFGVVGHEYNQLGVVGTGENRINDAWTHLAMVYDKPAAKLKLYVNGIKKGETNYDGTILYDNSPIQIGRDIENGNPAFFTDGKIDDIAVYDRPLTEEEIRSMACMEGSYAFADLSATEACEGGTSDVTIAFPALSAGAVVDISYKLDEGAVKTAAATINSANQAMFQTSVITVAATLTLLEVKAHGADCGQAFTGSNTVLITTKDCSAGDPVAWYPFDGNARDVIGSLDGTVNGATLTSDRFGNPNSAYAFDGIDDFIETATVATSQTDNWAITTWIKPANLVQEGAVAMNGYDDLGSGNGYTVLLKNSQLSGLFSGVSWYDSDK